MTYDMLISLNLHHFEQQQYLHTNQFELEPMQSYLSEKDDIYREEIDAIRRLVPLKERPKYFR